MDSPDRASTDGLQMVILSVDKQLLAKVTVRVRGRVRQKVKFRAWIKLGLCLLLVDSL